MNRLFLGAALAASVLVAAPAASAAQFINLSPPDAGGNVTGFFGNDGIVSGLFTNTFNFSFPASGLGGATISSVLSGLDNATNVDFSSVKLNGVEFNIASTGDFESRYINNLAVPNGPQQLVVKGLSGGDGSYGGDITFEPGAVPEPATWSLMILGLGAAGVTIRRRGKLIARAA